MHGLSFETTIAFLTTHLSVTARTKCYSREGSFVDCSIEDTKLKREEEEGREEE
jgi:hypothetical protein